MNVAYYLMRFTGGITIACHIMHFGKVDPLIVWYQKNICSVTLTVQIEWVEV